MDACTDSIDQFLCLTNLEKPLKSLRKTKSHFTIDRNAPRLGWFYWVGFHILSSDNPNL